MDCLFLLEFMAQFPLHGCNIQRILQPAKVFIKRDVDLAFFPLEMIFLFFLKWVRLFFCWWFASGYSIDQ